ncbi:MAG: response regulator transcription factor [Clostridia bacterium]|nr:response regulator transcription factor [Clostridia bacterium]
MRLLLAEDEEMMADAVIAYLSYHGHTTDWADNGLDALEKAELNSYDCLILDVMMPKMDGVTMLKQYRKEGGTAPAIFLTAKGAMDDKIQGFEAGGDDYLTKPFAMEELLLRVNAMAKRGRAILSQKMAFSDLVLDRDSCTLWCGGASCPLSHRELQLLEFFIRNPRVYFSADTLLDRVWGIDTEVEQGTVWVHISYLRKKFENLGAHAVISSKRGIGYALEETT